VEEPKVTKSRLITSFFIALIICTLSANSFAKPKAVKCGFNGDYSFFFFAPSDEVAGVGFFTVQLSTATNCRSGVVLPGGIINCNVDEDVFEDFIEDGFVFLESDGEGTMEIETNSSSGICDTGKNAIEFDISVVQGGKRVLLGTNGVEKVQSGTTPNAGYDYILTGRAGRCFPGDISGCYDIHFWDPAEEVGEKLAGDCTICVGGGFVLSGSCRCNTDFDSDSNFETLSEIETGGYTLGENCQSSTGFMELVTSSDEVCGQTSLVFLDFAVAAQGQEIMGSCDGDNVFNCAFEGWKQ
jgi:hypothetical protein